MGILDRILGRSGEQPAPDGGGRHDQPAPDRGFAGLVKLSGTTTICRSAMSALAERHGIADGGYLELPGSLQREPNNEVDANAVAVLVEGERVGYLPGYLTSEVDIPIDGSQTIRVQIFTELVPKGLRAEAWAWLGPEQPKWAWTEAKRPPMSSKAKAEASHAQSSNMVRDALASGGDRAAQFEAGMVKGVHYLELVEPIKQLKREGRLEEALVLSYAGIEGAEGERDGRAPAPWYSEQAAIILRKLGRRDEELAVLERWLAVCPPQFREGSRIAERVAKLGDGV